MSDYPTRTKPLARRTLRVRRAQRFGIADVVWVTEKGDSCDRTPIVWPFPIIACWLSSTSASPSAWKNYAHGGKQGQMTLAATEFPRRFFLHVLPKGSYASVTSDFSRIAGVSLAWRCAGNCSPSPPLRPQKPEPAKFRTRILPSGTARVATRP